MTNKEAAHAAIEAADGDIFVAAEAIYKGAKPLAIYVITVGLDKLKARRRATNRREIRREVKPEFKQGKTYGSVVLTPQAKKRLSDSAQRLFGKDGWDIGDLNIGYFTREDLLAQASKERASAKGHIRNARFYEALAEPMKPGQIVKDYWKPEAASKIKTDIWQKSEDKKVDLVD